MTNTDKQTEKTPLCRTFCGVVMPVKGVYIYNPPCASPDLQGSLDGATWSNSKEGFLKPCFKCPKCGLSWI